MDKRKVFAPPTWIGGTHRQFLPGLRHPDGTVDAIEVTSMGHSGPRYTPAMMEMLGHLDPEIRFLLHGHALEKHIGEAILAGFPVTLLGLRDITQTLDEELNPPDPDDYYCDHREDDDEDDE